MPNASIIGCTNWSATVSDYAFVISTSVTKNQPQLQDISYAVTVQPQIFDNNSQIFKKNLVRGVSQGYECFGHGYLMATVTSHHRSWISVTCPWRVHLFMTILSFSFILQLPSELNNKVSKQQPPPPSASLSLSLSLSLIPQDAINNEKKYCLAREKNQGTKSAGDK